jgi:NADH:ubiquinone oxidoreductase subunit 5 (subunit L)/multisubunit Na+/H+ antiporter MnhA subunit
MYLTIVFLPCISFLIIAVAGKHLGPKGSCFLATGFLFLTFILSCFAFFDIGFSNKVVCFCIGSWIKNSYLDIPWGFLFDSLTVVMLLVVTSVSSLVHLYSISYMEGDPHHPRFMSYLSLFTFFMLILVTANNLVQMFIGWEGVGLSSYLLINFWHTRIQANKAAIKAMIVNRIGDLGLALGIMACFF